MAFVKVSNFNRSKMFREGGFREREIMKKAKCVTSSKHMKNCVTFHDTKNRKSATYCFGRGWVK